MCSWGSQTPACGLPLPSWSHPCLRKFRGDRGFAPSTRPGDCLSGAVALRVPVPRVKKGDRYTKLVQAGSSDKYMLSSSGYHI